LYRSSIQPEALASLVRGNAAVECRPNGVADCIGSEVRILDRIEPLTAEADLTGEIDCSHPRPRKGTTARRSRRRPRTKIALITALIRRPRQVGINGARLFGDRWTTARGNGVRLIRTYGFPPRHDRR